MSLKGYHVSKEAREEIWRGWTQREMGPQPCRHDLHVARLTYDLCDRPGFGVPQDTICQGCGLLFPAREIARLKYMARIRTYGPHGQSN